MSSLTVCILCLLSPVLKNVEDDHLNDSLGNPGLISPDKEDLSRLLVRQKPPLSPFFLFKVHARFLAPGLCVIHVIVLCVDGAFQRAHPGRHAARQEDHSDGHCRPGAGEVR